MHGNNDWLQLTKNRLCYFIDC